MEELKKLQDWLEEHGYDVERIDKEPVPGNMFIMEIHQVIVRDSEKKRMFDAICQPGSYGYEQGLLEIGDADYDVEGYLTADEIIKRLIDNGA